MCYHRRVLHPKSFRHALRLCAALLLVALATSTLAAPRRAAPADGRKRFASAEQTAPRHLQFQTLPLERSRQNHLLLRARINGKPALLGVDSGAPVSAIAINRVAHFGLTPATANSGVPTRLRINGSYNKVVTARSFLLGSLNLVDEPLVAVDLSGSSRAAKLMNEEPIDGSLGADVLFPTHAVLDCRRQLLILKIDPEARGSAPGVDYSGFSGVPMHVSPGYNLYVDSKLNGRAAKLMVDTGAFGTLLHNRFVRQMKIPLRESPFSSAGVNLKNRGVQLATINKFSVGSVQLRSKEVGVIDLEGLIRTGMLNASPPVAGLLGSEILQRYNGIIDFGTKTLYLKR
jgi:predicted aspartyl protease